MFQIKRALDKPFRVLSVEAISFVLFWCRFTWQNGNKTKNANSDFLTWPPGTYFEIEMKNWHIQFYENIIYWSTQTKQYTRRTCLSVRAKSRFDVTEFKGINTKRIIIYNLRLCQSIHIIHIFRVHEKILERKLLYAKITHLNTFKAIAFTYTCMLCALYIAISSKIPNCNSFLAQLQGNETALSVFISISFCVRSFYVFQ